MDGATAPLSEVLTKSAGVVSKEVTKSAKAVSKEMMKGGRRMLSDVQDKANTLADTKQDAAGDFLKTMSEALTEGAGYLSERGYGGGSQIVTFVAKELDSFADEVSGRTPREMLDEATALARRHPGVMIAGALLAGFAVIRLFRADDSDDEGDSEDEE